HLAGLGERFLAALDAVRAGRLDEAAEELRAILKVEPRLAEPRIELARLHLQTGQLEEAAEQAQEAIRILENGGQWTEDLDEDTVLSLAWNIRAEALRQQADQDSVVFGDPAEWERLMKESREAFATAARLDPQNEHARYWAGGTDVAPPGEPEGEDEDDGAPPDLAELTAAMLGAPQADREEER
ncbi:MAG: hypothetical protein D6798_05960, partial [Deltaproteobacteria bacterium]